MRINNTRKRLKMCRSKKTYITYEQAIYEAQKLCTERSNLYHKLRAYRCPYCNFFHLTSDV